MSVFDPFFGRREKKNRRFAAPLSRKPHIEPLETRVMLSISPAEYDAIRAAYPDLELSANIDDYNVIEVTALELSREKLQSALDTSRETVRNDLIVLHTSSTQNEITLSGQELSVEWNASRYGSVSIVRFGDTPLTIDAGQRSHHLSLANESHVALAGMIFTNGSMSGENGGAILSRNSTLRLVDMTFENNVSGGTHWWISGGAVRSQEGGKLDVFHSTFQNNTSLLAGGGLSASDVHLTIADTIFRDNTCNSYGGGVYCNGGSLSVERTQFIANASGGNGGGIWIENCTANLKDALFRDNRALWGAGLRVEGSTVSVSDAVFYDNHAVHDGGGADFIRSHVTLSDAAFWNNDAGLYGGGLFFEGGTATLGNVTAGYNTSGTDGGGIFIRGGGQAALYNLTLAHNTARWGGGLYVRDSSEVTIENTIIAGNIGLSVAGDVFQNDTAKPLEGTHNIIGIAVNLVGLTNGVHSNIIGTQDDPVDAMLGPMTDFGNGIPVMPLLSQSPAIDAGVSKTGVPETDAAGNPRYDHPDRTDNGTGTPSYIDIGAFEFQGKTVSGTLLPETGRPLRPKGMAVDSRDRIILADHSNHRLIVYSCDGTELFTFGRWGEGDGQVYHPFDVAVDKNDNIYVVSKNSTVQVFDSTGTFLRSFGEYGTAAGKLNAPEGITYDAATDRIYVADTGNQRVQCFTANGQLVTTFGSGGILGTTGVFQHDHSGFDRPADVAVHPLSGYVYIADRVNSRLEVYDADGIYLRTYHAVYQPESLAFQPDGDLLIAGDDDMKGGDYVNSAFEGRVRVLQNGGELSSTTFYGGIDDLGRKTSGLAVLSNGDIIVSDEYNNRLARTHLRGTGRPFPEGREFVENITDIELDTYGTEVIVRWKTASPSPSFLRWGSDKNDMSGSNSDARPKTEHELKITGLSPQTLLYFQIGFGDSFTPDTTRWTQPDKINSGVPLGEKLVLRLKAIGLIYADVNDQAGITPASEEQIRQIEQLYRDAAVFIWQNTGFNVWIDFIDVPVYTGDFIREDKMSVEEILSGLGYGREDDIDLVLDTSICWGGAGGGVGGSGYLFGRGVGWSYQEWDKGGTLLHELNHAFDFAVYGWHDIGKYENVHAIWSVSDSSGGGISNNAQIYRNLYNANYTATGGDFDNWILVADADHDGLPDESPRDQGLVTPLPITEKSLGTSPREKDTDGDGISDYEEAAYFAYGGIDPLSADTDGDGIPDGLDLNPGYPIGERVSVGTPQLDGVITEEENWTLVLDRWSCDNTFAVWDNNANAETTRLAMAWDEDYLYYYSAINWHCPAW